MVDSNCVGQDGTHIDITVELQKRFASDSALVTTLVQNRTFQGQLPPAMKPQSHSCQIKKLGKGKMRKPEAARL